MGVTVIYENTRGDKLEFSSLSGIRITSIDGLSTNTIDLSESSVDKQIGSTITGVSVQSKDITIEGRYRYTPEKRKQILSVIVPGVSAKLRFIDTTSDVDVYWEGMPTKTPVLSYNPIWQSFQFVFRAPFPYARTYTQNITRFNYLESKFKFKQTYSSTKEWKISDRIYSPLQTIKNKGSMESGFIIRMIANVDGVKAPKLTCVDTQENISFPKLVLNTDDVLEVSTYDNEKYCHLIRGEETINVFPYMDYESSFFKLKTGDNVIRYSADENEKNLEVVLSFNEVFAGV